jgi:outer membrane protein assembly factor BamB
LVASGDERRITPYDEGRMRTLSMTLRPAAYRIALIAMALVAGSSSAWAAWPLFRGTSRQLGVAPGRLPAKLRLAWKVKLGGAPASSAVISGGRVYLGQGKAIVALRLRDGGKAWTYPTGGAVEATPCVAGGSVISGSEDGYLYCVNAANGTLRWKYRTDDKIMGAANVVPSPKGKGTWLVVGSYDNRVHCIDLATGKAVWTFETGNYVNGTPAVSNGQVVFGGCDGVLYVLRLVDGQKIRTVQVEDYIAGSTAVDGQSAFLGHYGNAVLHANISTGKIVWAYRERNFPYFSSPAVAPDRIVIGSRDKRLHCLRRSDGKAIWELRTRGKVDSSPVICDGKVIVGSEDGRLYVVSLANGRELWSYEIGGPVMSSPAVSDGMVVVGSADGSVYAFRGA